MSQMTEQDTLVSHHNHGALIVILLAQLMIVVDGTVVYTALPVITTELGFSASASSWVLNAYMLMFGGFMLLGGCAGDRLKHQYVFMVTSILFIIASCAAGIAETSFWLIITRALQGVTAAFVAPSAFALLMLLFEEEHRRVRAIRWYTAVSGAGSALGLVLGGLLTSYLSWRYIFFINLPIGILLLIGAVRFLPSIPQRTSGKLDLLGALTCTAGMFLVVYGLLQATEQNSGYAIHAVISGLLIMALFVGIERSSSAPILPLSLFNNALRTGAYCSKFMLVAGMLGTFFVLTQYCQQKLGLSAFETAFIFLPLSLVQFTVVVYGSPRILPILGPRKLLLSGLLTASFGMVWLFLLADSDLFIIDFILPVMLLGAGSGCALVPLAVLGVRGISGNESGAASGVVNATQYLGGAFGTAIIIWVNDYFLPIVIGPDGTEFNPMAVSALCSTLFFACAMLITILTAPNEV